MTMIATSKRLILGAGPTGQAVARHFQSLGVPFDVADTRIIDPVQEEFTKQFPNVNAYYGPLRAEFLDRYDEIVASPGIPPHISGLCDTSSKIVSDVQLFRRAWPENQILVAITGSNAKSTVTSLVTSILVADDREVLTGGNLGPQALDLLKSRSDESVAVLEVSSFQLCRTSNLKAAVATCLNMTPDHLDWHETMIEYHRAKHRIFEGAGAIVVNADDPLSQPLVPDQTPTIKFALQHPEFHRFGIMVVDDSDWIALGADPWIRVSDLPFVGDHMLQNVMAAFGICHLLGVESRAAIRGVQSFQSLPHRMAELKSVGGIRFINDSKGTNTGASETAVKSVVTGGRLLLLAGGDSKAADLASWGVTIRAVCHLVYLYGQDKDRLKSVLGNKAHVSPTLDDAFKQALTEARSGDVIMLSPACASFDQFPSYQARGIHFQSLVAALHEN